MRSPGVLASVNRMPRRSQQGLWVAAMTLTFDADRHVYYVDGKPIPNVTSILNELWDFERFVDHETLEYARSLGTAVHDCTEFHDRGTLDEDTVPAEAAPYLAAYRKFLHDENPQILLIEQIVTHGLHRYAGKLDRGVKLRNRRGILDIKSSKAIDLALVGPQTAAYLEAANYTLRATLTPAEYLSECFERRWALKLCDDGTYELTECKDTADLAVFLSCLNIRKWRAKHGLSKR